MDPLTLPGTLESLKPIRDYVEAAGKAAALDHRAIYRLCLAVDEIASNAVVHGYEEAGRSGPLRISAELTGDAVRVTLEDEGLPYDSLKHAPPSERDLSLPLEERRSGGLGIYLACQGVDRLDYSRVGDVNRNVFTVFCSTSRGA